MSKQIPVWERAMHAARRYGTSGKAGPANPGQTALSIRESRIYAQGWQDGRLAGLKERKGT